MWPSFPQLIGFAFVAIAVYVHHREQWRVGQINQSAGKILLAIRRPAIQSVQGWAVLLAMAFFAFETISDGLRSASRFEQVRDIGLGLLLLTSAWLIFRSFKRGESLVEAKFGEDGIVVGEGVLLTWQEISRWTWLDTPHRQLNLFVPGAVHTVRIPTSADQQQAENILLRKVKLSEETHASVPG